jgi:uncharacterized membrane protein YsdA (DUF1294 family)
MVILSIPATLLAVMTALNIIVFAVFAADKDAARKNSNRISEQTLLLLSLFGPFGAYGAMKVFRHKTQKIGFYLVPLFLLLHLAGIVYGLVVFSSYFFT